MKYSIRDIIANPLSAYQEFRSRIQRDGANASFPEFQPAVMEIIEALNSERFGRVFEAHPDLLLEKSEVMTILSHVNILFEFDDPEGIHPYEIPFSAPFPYRPTLEAIDSGLRLLDKLNRLEPGNRAVPLYHFDRYAYHKFGIFGNPDVIIIPVAEDIDVYDLLRVRSVPIGFVGVVTETVRVDRHWQSPLDFWYHDINHVRRMCEYFRQRIKQQGIADNPHAIDAYYATMENFLADILVPAIIEQDVSLPLREKAIRRMVKIILFEIVHESALTAEPEVIIQELIRAGGPQPFEHMITDVQQKPDDIEDLRTPTGNLASGASVVGADAMNPITIRYFFDRSLGFLSTVYNKLNFGFYDDPESPSEFIVPLEYRTPECMIEAVHRLWELCGVHNVLTDEELSALITSREGSYEKYVYKGLLVDEESPKGITETYATDPMPPEMIIKDIRNLDKKVCLLMGYSVLEYADYTNVMEEIRKTLLKFDPTEYVVCIGATEEGIGRAYQVAKNLGFETIGVVSTLALTYTGKFSKCVDRIYIVNDNRWGGYIPGTKQPSDTTRVFLEIADIIYAFGGGDNTAALLDVRQTSYSDTPAFFIPAEMNHQKAKEREVYDYQGSASKVAIRQNLLSE